MNGIRATASVTIALLAGFALVGCGYGGAGGDRYGYGSDDDTSPTPTGDGAASDILGEWQLTKGTDADGDLTVTGKPVTLVIAEGAVSGQAPCNTFTGEATVDGSDIAIGTIAQTLMACTDDDANELESRYLKALERVTTAKVDDGTLKTLTLSGPDETLSFAIIEKKAAN